MGGYHAPAMRIAGALLLSLGSIGSMALAPAMHATLPVEVVPNSKRQRQGDGRSDFKGRRLRAAGASQAKDQPGPPLAPDAAKAPPRRVIRCPPS